MWSVLQASHTTSLLATLLTSPFHCNWPLWYTARKLLPTSIFFPFVGTVCTAWTNYFSNDPFPTEPHHSSPVPGNPKAWVLSPNTVSTPLGQASSLQSLVKCRLWTFIELIFRWDGKAEEWKRSHPQVNHPWQALPHPHSPSVRRAGIQSHPFLSDPQLFMQIVNWFLISDIGE